MTESMCCLSELAKQQPEPEDKAVKRMVIVDGCNFLSKVGSNFFDLSTDKNKDNARSALILIHEFLEMGFQVVFVVKEYFLDRKNTNHNYILQHLHEAGIVHVMPDEEDDDMEILRQAKRLDAFVISNDKYRQSIYDDFEEVRKRVIGFTYTNDKTYSAAAYFPYPGGLFVSELDFHFTVSQEEFNEIAYRRPHDPTYPLVKYCNDHVDEDYAKIHAACGITVKGGYFEETKKRCEVLEDFIRLGFCMAFASKMEMKPKCAPYFDYSKEKAVPKRFDRFYEYVTSYTSAKFKPFIPFQKK